jgi:hypothetical protein
VKRICGKTSSTGVPRLFPAYPDYPRASLEHILRAIKDRMSDPLSVRSPHWSSRCAHCSTTSRLDGYTICTAVAPDLVLTVLTSGTKSLCRQPLVRKLSFREQQTSRPQPHDGRDHRNLAKSGCRRREPSHDTHVEAFSDKRPNVLSDRVKIKSRFPEHHTPLIYRKPVDKIPCGLPRMRKGRAAMRKIAAPHHSGKLRRSGICAR